MMYADAAELGGPLCKKQRLTFLRAIGFEYPQSRSLGCRISDDRIDLGAKMRFQQALINDSLDAIKAQVLLDNAGVKIGHCNPPGCCNQNGPPGLNRRAAVSVMPMSHYLQELWWVARCCSAIAHGHVAFRSVCRAACSCTTSSAA